MIAEQPFSRKLRWALLGVYVVGFAGVVVNAIAKFLTGSTYYLGYFLPLAVFAALLVQLVALVIAIFLLASESRYRTGKNIALAVAGVFPITGLVVSGMIGGFRFHM